MVLMHLNKDRREVDRVKMLPLFLAVLCSACAQSIDAPLDRSTHVERVLEDVSAMIEGMASAHTERRVVLRGPEYRSSSPRAPE